MVVDGESETRLRAPGRVVAATGRNPAAHRQACRAACDGAASRLLSLRTTGEYVGVCPSGASAAVTAVEFDPGREDAGTPVRREHADSDSCRLVATDPAGLVAAVANVGRRSDESLSVCVDSLRPVRQQGTDDDLFWVLRAIGSVLVGREWDCHVHHPVAPGASLPPELDHLVDERVALTGQEPSTATDPRSRGGRASD